MASSSHPGPERSPGVDPGRLIAATRDFIPQVMRREYVPGLNIALALDGEVIWEEGFGFADLGRRRPMTPATVMRSGSMGKTYTATAVMQLVEQGHIGLYQPINQHLDFRITNPLGEREITPYDLLTHRSGLAVNMANSHLSTPPVLGDHLRHAYAGTHHENFDGRSAPMWTARVGERYQYSNLGMATLGYLVERANPDGLSFSDYQQTHLIDPLGMTSTQYPPVPDAAHVRPDILAQVSTGYAMFGPLRVPTPNIVFADFPAGGILTTPGDHIRVLLAYLNGGAYNGYQLLRPETVRMMLTPQTDTGAEGMAGHLGITWGLNHLGTPNFYFGHGGAHMYGWHNDYRAYPNLGIALVIAVNEWPMLKTRYAAHNLIANFVTSWVQHEGRTGMDRPTRPWAWKLSYLAGVEMARSIVTLGIRQPLTPAAVEAMAMGTEDAVWNDEESHWDAGAFRAGIDDVLALDRTPEAMAAFLTSDALRVSPGEVELLRRELGAVG